MKQLHVKGVIYDSLCVVFCTNQTLNNLSLMKMNLFFKKVVLV